MNRVGDVVGNYIHAPYVQNVKKSYNKSVGYVGQKRRNVFMTNASQYNPIQKAME